MKIKMTALGLAALVAVSGCKKQEAAPATPVAQPPAATPAEPKPAEAAKPAEFDINSVPVSTATLGAFPYITLPQGYSSDSYGKTNKSFARFPFWVNGKEHWVEGKFFGTMFDATGDKDFSQLEVTRNFDNLVQQMGGVKVFDGKIPASVVEGWPSDVKAFDGLGDVYNENPVTTYVVRRADGNIWIHLCTNTMSGGYIVGQEKPFQQTATLLPASELKKQIDASGKVALQVNFATDKTDILPDSQPQLEQVVQLLKDDPALKLAVNGHTDNSGDKTHNQQLSQGRAAAVVAALTAKGVEAARLEAKGFGDTQPVADNATDAGKAKNRRVELVKR